MSSAKWDGQSFPGFTLKSRSASTTQCFFFFTVSISFWEKRLTKRLTTKGRRYVSATLATNRSYVEGSKSSKSATDIASSFRLCHSLFDALLPKIRTVHEGFHPVFIHFRFSVIVRKLSRKIQYLFASFTYSSSVRSLVNFMRWLFTGLVRLQSWCSALATLQSPDVIWDNM